MQKLSIKGMASQRQLQDSPSLLMTALYIQKAL